MTQDHRNTPEQVRAFAKFIDSNTEVMDEIMERVNHSLFDRFITADNATRAEISSIINAGQLWRAELNSILQDTYEDPNS